ncbi:MAG: hypothetical protein ACK4L7_03290 [Flavobacteriales bacterium]
MRPVLLGSLLCCSAAAIAQRAVLPGGHDATGAGGSLGCSIGQVDYQASSMPDGSVAQGVQQPYEMLMLAMEEPEGRALSALLQPNPARDHATIAIAGEVSLPLRYELRDAQGRLLRAGPIATATAALPMDGLPPAAYLVHVLAQGSAPLVLQLIKH